MAWARSTSAQWPKKKLSASLRQHLQSKNSPIAGATYSSAACIRSTSIFAIATVPVVTMPMPGMIMRFVWYRVVEVLFKRRSPSSPDSSRMTVDSEHPCKSTPCSTDSAQWVCNIGRGPLLFLPVNCPPGGYPQRFIVHLDLCLRRPATALCPVGRVGRAGNSRRMSRHKEALSIPGCPRLLREPIQQHRGLQGQFGTSLSGCLDHRPRQYRVEALLNRLEAWLSSP